MSRKYKLTFAVIAHNLFNTENLATPNAVLTSPPSLRFKSQSHGWRAVQAARRRCATAAAVRSAWKEICHEKFTFRRTLNPCAGSCSRMRRCTLVRDVAQDLVMFLRRPGGQSQFSRLLLNQSMKPGPIRDLQSWILENLAHDLSVEKLAERVAMSPRNFTRVFTRETGTAPAKYVEQVRLDAARRHLEEGNEGLEQVATTTGFGNGLNLRRVFERSLHLTPSEYRERFCSRILA